MFVGDIKKCWLKEIFVYKDWPYRFIYSKAAQNATLSASKNRLPSLKPHLSKWMGDLEQVDDITVIGIHIR